MVLFLSPTSNLNTAGLGLGLGLLERRDVVSLPPITATNSAESERLRELGMPRYGGLEGHDKERSGSRWPRQRFVGVLVPLAESGARYRFVRPEQFVFDGMQYNATKPYAKRNYRIKYIQCIGMQV